MMTSTAKSTTVSSLSQVPTTATAATATTSTTKVDTNEDILRAANSSSATAAAVDDDNESQASSELQSEQQDDVDDELCMKAKVSKKVPVAKNVSKNEATHILETMLKEHRCQEIVLRRRWKKLRNQREALTIAASLDARKHPIEVEEEDVDILVSRLQALFLADYTKSWAVARHLEKVPQPGAEIIPDIKLQAALKRSELYKKAMNSNTNNSKPQPEAEAESEDDE
jgi:hypothetical protein